MGEGDTFLNALLGALVTVVLTAIPFSPVVGGVVAGYLQGPDRGAGARVGAIAGAFAALPLVLVFLLFGGVALAILPFAGPGPDFAVVSVLGLIFLLFMFLFVMLYSVALSALGGYLGAALKDEDVI